MAPARPITPAELSVIEALAALAIEPIDLTDVGTARVAFMDDGGMGSIAIDPARPHGPLRAAALGEASDRDGTVLSLCLFIDETGRPRELDVWKVDFSPLITLPDPADIVPGPDPLHPPDQAPTAPAPSAASRTAPRSRPRPVGTGGRTRPG